MRMLLIAFWKYLSLINNSSLTSPHFKVVDLCITTHRHRLEMQHRLLDVEKANPLLGPTLRLKVRKWLEARYLEEASSTVEG